MVVVPSPVVVVPVPTVVVAPGAAGAGGAGAAGGGAAVLKNRLYDYYDMLNMIYGIISMIIVEWRCRGRSCRATKQNNNHDM